MTRRRRDRDRGIATVWAAAGVALLTAALVVGLHLGAAIAARHQAEAAADLAALAAAGRAALGTPAACARAVTIAIAMGGRVTHCELAGWDALVEVQTPMTVAVPGHDTATGRARAGPGGPAKPPADTTPPT